MNATPLVNPAAPAALPDTTKTAAASPETQFHQVLQPRVAPKDLFAPSADRMRTGIEGLDHLLEGGLVRGESLLLEGPPGSAKTTFAVRMIYEGVVKYDESSLIITFEEFPKQIYQESASYGLDLTALENQGKLRLIWTSPSRILEGFTGKNDLIDRVVNQMNIRRIVIDSVTHFKRVAESEQDLREALGRILSYLKIRDINAILIKEIQDLSEEKIAFEEYLVDASIRLYSDPSAIGGESRRSIEIRKTRGQNHISGRHPFRLRPTGPVVFPHLRIVDLENMLGPDHPAGPDRVSLGSGDLDSIMGGGLWNRSVTLLSGPPGVGKSVLANMFLNSESGGDGKGLLIRFKPDGHNLRPTEATADSSANSNNEVLYIEPAGLTTEEAILAMCDKIRDARPGRIVVDSVDDLLELAYTRETRADLIRLLFGMLRKSGATSVVLNESGSDSQEGDLIERRKLAYLADTGIQLAAGSLGHRIRREFSVLKHLGSSHCLEPLQYTIAPDGFHFETNHAEPLTEICNLIQEAISREETSPAAREGLRRAARELERTSFALEESMGGEPSLRVASEA